MNRSLQKLCFTVCLSLGILAVLSRQACGQISITGPNKVDAGKTGIYAVNYSSSSCSGAGGTIYCWSATSGTVQASTSGCTSQQSMQTSLLAADSSVKAAGTLVFSPDVGLPGGCGECPNADVTWGHVLSLTTGSVTVSDNCHYTYTLNVSIVPPLVNNITVSPASQTVAYGGAPTTITISQPQGGDGSYSYQWQMSTDDVNWTNIQFATQSSYSPATIFNAFYRVQVISFDYIAYSSVAAVTTQLYGGQVTPLTQTLSSYTAPATLTDTTVAGDTCSEYAYQWQQSTDGISFSNIAGANDNIYTPGAITRNTWYRLASSCGSHTAYSDTAAVYIPLTGGLISVSPAVVSSGGTATLSSVTGAGNGACSGSYTYQWQSSPDEITWTNLGSTTVTDITSALFFRRKTICGTDFTYSNTVRVKLAASSATILPNSATGPTSTATPIPMPSYPTSVNATNLNYIRVRQVNKPGVMDTATADGLTSPYDVSQVTSYYDGLGRQMQQVSKQSTPGQHDMISTTFYDAFDRVSQQYLPYTDNGAGGGFRTNANTQQPAFYNSQFNNTEGFYYSNTVYDSSPLNETLEATGPGKSWTGSNNGIRQEDVINTFNDSVRIWTIGYGEDSLPRVMGMYLPGTLAGQVATDENGNKVMEYKDLLGRLILKKLQVTDALQPGHTGWLCTYYVYDDMNTLRCVIPPKAVEWLQANSWTMTLTIRNNLCFSYLYDERQRPVMKQAPGGGKVYLVYDNRDRVVFSQDANLRAASPTAEWVVSFYDGMNRPVMTALYPTTASRTSLQSSMDAVNGTTANQTYSIPAPADMTVDQRDASVSQYTARNSITFLPGFSSATGDSFTASINASANSTTETVTVTNPLPNITGYTPLTYTYYDDYTSWQGAKSFNSSYSAKFPSPGANQHPDAVASSLETRGMTTGTKVRMLNTPSEQWITTTTYYDSKNRPVQTLQTNITGGTDVQTNQYDFTGRVLGTYLDHNNARSATTPDTRVLTMMQYDHGGRLLSITKQLNDDATTKKTIASYSYNELGQLVKKSIGGTPSAPLDTLHYDYNIRGWLSGINKPYVNNTATLTPAPGRFFGTELDYDYGYNQPQVNGNIAGAKWKSAGDGYGRSFGYSYDNANRLAKADFSQNNSGAWNNTLGSGTIDFSVKNLAYDANGNIQSMKQMGLKVNNSATVDALKYSYNTNSNQLYSVTDTANDANTTLGDFHDGSNGAGTADYSYDGNGNLTEDLNKSISAITYNYLNLPQQVTLTGKGTIQYIYDANGVKWQKIVTDQTQSPAVVTTTTYIDGFIYQRTSSAGTDTLQYLSDEEGRIRHLLPPSGGAQGGWVYDYFEKDHLGNVRMVLTEQTDEAAYAATMEPQNATVENQLFDNITATEAATPTGFGNTTYNKDVSRLNGSSGSGTTGNPRVGPAIVLRVMAGDTITIATRAWYQGTVQPPPAGAYNLLNDLLNALTGDVIGTDNHGLYGTGDNNPSTVLSGDLPTFFTNDENNHYVTTRPKAFLNWVAFDGQLNMVSTNSGVVQVPPITAGDTNQALVAPTQIIAKNGYIYIYVSNESAQDVFFDQLVIHHNRGPILQEDHYYPFGLSMAGISDIAALKPENRFKFNDGSELQHKEFSDGTGLEEYSTAYRGYDPQIGRFHAIDPMAADMISPYAYSLNNPICFNDPSGMKAESLGNFLYNTLYNPNSNGGSWTADGSSDDESGDPMGNDTYYGSQEEALYAGADQMDAAGSWSGGGGSFASSDQAATNTFNQLTGDHLLPEVTINPHNPGSVLGAQLQIHQEVQNVLDNLDKESATQITSHILDAVGLSWEGLRGGVSGAQKLGNTLSGTSDAVLDLGKMQLAKIGRFGINAEIVGKTLGVTGMLLTGYDMTENGINWSNGTDLTMEGVAFIPGVGWIITGAYFISNIVVEHYSGESIGQHIGDVFNDPVVQEGIDQQSVVPPTF